MKHRNMWMRAALAVVLGAGMAACAAGDVPTTEAGSLLVPVGDVRPVTVESPRAFRSSAGDAWRQTVTSPGAAFVRVHFTGMNLEAGAYVLVSSPDGQQVWRYEGRGPQGDGDVWAFAIDGDTAIVEKHGGGAGGFVIAEVGHGTVPISPEPEVVCSEDGREDIACHQSDPLIDAAQRPVARLLFTIKGHQYLCTGWLIAGQNPSTLITNNHCFSTQREVNTVQAMFNYQRTGCLSGAIAATASYAGGTFLKTSSVDRKGRRGGLDYTLATLRGDPEAQWGALVATTRQPAVNDQIWFIQHPGGEPKVIGYYEDTIGEDTCAVDAVNQTYGRSAPGSQVAYACDSEGGSSGSPIVGASDGRVLALHHFGNVVTLSCLNSGTKMSEICADAGALLSCAQD